MLTSNVIDDVTALLPHDQFNLACEGVCQMLRCFPGMHLLSRWQAMPDGQVFLTLAHVPGDAELDPDAALAQFDAWWLTQCDRDTTGMVFDYERI